MEGRSISDIAAREAWSTLWRAPSGRWPAIRWGLAIILPIAVFLWGVSLLLAPGDPETLTIRVVSQVTGEGIKDASITVGQTRYVTDEKGEIRIDPVDPGIPFSVSALGYESTRGEVEQVDRHDLTVYLNGVLVMGAVSDTVSGEPIVGAHVTAQDANGRAFSSTGTDASGGFIFKSIPEDARLQVVDPLYGESMHHTDGRRSVPIELDPPPVTGLVVDVAGQPIEGALVSAPSARASSDKDGVFTLDPVGQGSEAEVSAEGHGSTILVVEGTELGDIILPATATPSSGVGT